MFSLSFFFKKNNPDKPALLDQDVKNKNNDSLPPDITVLGQEDMIRIEGGKSSSQLMEELRRLGSSCGDTIPQ